MEPNFMDEIDCSNFFDHIDDLIDFPPENECGGGDINSGDCKDFQSIWNDTLPENDPLFAGTSSASASDLSAELAVPYEDIVQLEWLSTFVEDSFAGSGMTIAKENNPVNSINMVNIEMPNNQFQTCSPISVLESSSSSSSSSFGSVGKITPLPVEPSHRGAQRARSKRPRPATFTPRPPMQLLSPTSSFTDPPKLFLTPIENCEESQPIKKKKKIKLTFSSAMAEMKDNPPAQGMRKCLHCEITKTPQWRTGPLGPKTLCNACGVRYKSGRLFPEYRPAASPTFVPALHSNSHKKVVEMRSKEVEKGNNMGVKAAFTSTTPKPESIPFVE